MKCKNCNADIPADAVICLNCFTEIENDDLAQKRRKRLVWGLLPFCCAVFLLVLFAFFPSCADDPYDVPALGGEVAASGEDAVTTSGDDNKKESDGIFSIFKKDDEKNTGNSESVKTEETTESKKSNGFWSSLFKKPTEKETLKETVKGTTSASSTEKNTEAGKKNNITEGGATTGVTSSSASLENDTTSITENGTAAPLTTVGNTENQSSTSDEEPSEVFEYVPYANNNKKISITKYNGKASFVTVPVYIDGFMVVELKTGAFKDNPYIKTVDIEKGERSYIWFKEKCFDNCSSLETINLYNNDLGLNGEFAVDCPIKNFNITYWQYRFVNGALYSNNSRCWEFKYFAGSPTYTTLTLESWCSQISTDNNLSSAYNLKVINAHKDISYIPTYSYDYTNNIEAINVEDGNNMYYSKDGVLFSKYALQSSSTKYIGFYPYSKADKTFVMPEKDGYTFSLSGNWGTVTNPYVEEIYVPLNASVSIGSNTASFPSLKRLYYKTGHPDYDSVRFDFYGETITY